jgi:hypothetical protein
MPVLKGRTFMEQERFTINNRTYLIVEMKVCDAEIDDYTHRVKLKRISNGRRHDAYITVANNEVTNIRLMTGK